MVKIQDIQNIKTKIRVRDISSLMTPIDLLSKQEFDRPFVITPEEFFSFEELLEHREEIRTLKLVPVKDEYMHNLYNSLDRGELFKNVINFFLKESEITCVENTYPYWLPKDVKQSLIWVSKEVEETAILFFISRLLAKWELSPKEVILFERPSNTKSILIKGTFPEVRHIHLWSKISPEY